MERWKLPATRLECAKKRSPLLSSGFRKPRQSPELIISVVTTSDVRVDTEDRPDQRDQASLRRKILLMLTSCERKPGIATTTASPAHKMPVCWYATLTGGTRPPFPSRRTGVAYRCFRSTRRCRVSPRNETNRVTRSAATSRSREENQSTLRREVDIPLIAEHDSKGPTRSLDHCTERIFARILNGRSCRELDSFRE